jgi:hypothetical protein
MSSYRKVKSSSGSRSKERCIYMSGVPDGDRKTATILRSKEKTEKDPNRWVQIWIGDQMTYFSNKPV